MIRCQGCSLSVYWYRMYKCRNHLIRDPVGQACTNTVIT